jgi:glycosyltransferase involved in cell wall biosynthesis
LSFFPCVDTTVFSSDARLRCQARTELGLPENATVIGNIGTLSPMKGHRTLIRAAAALRQWHPDARFVVLGSTHAGRDAYYAALRDEAKSYGLRLGRDLIIRDPGRHVATLAQAFDLYWMTSEPHSEGVPTAIGEAQALGRPVVATDVGSTSECVTDNVDGFVVPPRSPGQIALATHRILSDSALYRSMSTAARAAAARKYAAPLGAERHRQAYERALAHHATTKSSRHN